MESPLTKNWGVDVAAARSEIVEALQEYQLPIVLDSVIRNPGPVDRIAKALVNGSLAGPGTLEPSEGVSWQLRFPNGLSSQDINEALGSGVVVLAEMGKHVNGVFKSDNNQRLELSWYREAGAKPLVCFRVYEGAVGAGGAGTRSGETRLRLMGKDMRRNLLDSGLPVSCQSFEKDWPGHSVEFLQLGAMVYGSDGASMLRMAREEDIGKRGVLMKVGSGFRLYLAE